MAKCKIKNDVLKELRSKMSKEDFKIAKESFDGIAEMLSKPVEDTQLGIPSAEIDYEAIVDSYEGAKKVLIGEMNRQKPRVQHSKSKSDGYVVPIKIQRIVGNTAYYTYKDSNKIYEIPANSKSIKLDKADMDTMIREFAEVEHVYGNTEGAKRKWSKFKQIERNIHKDPQRMAELLEELYEADGKKESDEHMDQLRGLLSSLRGDFFKKMDVYMSDNAKGRGGVTSDTRIGVYFSNVAKKAANEMGAAEIYTHEIVHAITQFALDNASTDRQAAKLVKELDYLMESVMDRLTWQELVPKDSGLDKAREEEIAKDLYEYIFTNKNARAEFIAHALTNPAMMEKLKVMNLKPKESKKNVLETLVGWFTNMVDIILGNYEFKDTKKTAYEQAFSLTMALAEINNDAVNDAKSKSIMSSISDGINEGNEILANAIDKVIDKFKDEDAKLELLPEGASVMDKTVWTAKYLWVIMNNKTYRNYFGHVMSAWGVTPESIIRDWARAFMETSEMQKAVEWLGTTSDRIDAARNTVILETKKLVLDGFKRTLVDEDEEALTSVVVDADMQSIFKQKKFTNKKIREMLTDDAELEKQLNWAKSRVEKLDSERRNWYVNQAHVLGVYMATGEISTGMNFNAWNIARGIQSSEVQPVKGARGATLVREIDTIATLTALKYTNKKQKARVAELMKVEWSGVRNVIKTHEGFIEDSKNTVFKGNTTQMIKGYSKEIFDDKITMEIAPISDKAEMEAKGYELKEVLSKNDADQTADMGMYVATTFVTNERLRAATRMTRMGVKGTSIKDVHFKDGGKLTDKKLELAKIKLDRERVKVIKSMEDGTYEYMDIDSTVMAPVLDEYGNVTDYRYMMNKAAKKSYLGQDTKVSDVLARSFGNIIDKAGTQDHNKKVLNHILEVMNEDWIPGSTIGKSGEEYVLIGPKSTNKEAQEIYNVLPPMFKNAIKKHPQETLAVPRYLMHMYFGFRHLSIADFPGLKYVTTPFIRGVIRMVETMWIEAIKVLKGNILMKMPFVLIGNIVSNIVYAIMTGEVNPVTLFNDYKHSFADIRKYIKSGREISRLEVKEKSSSITNKEKHRLEMLKVQQSKSPIHELMEIGLYQAVAEDVEAMDVESTNKWKQVIDNKLKPVPTFVKTPLQWMYLSSETKWYKVNQEVLQMSDLIARDVENRRRKRMEEEQARGKRKLPSWWTEEHGDKEYNEYISKVEKTEYDIDTARERKRQAELSYRMGPGSGQTYTDEMRKKAKKDLDDSIKELNKLEKKLSGLKKDPVDKPKGGSGKLSTAEKKQFLKEAKARRHYGLLENYVNYNKPASRLEEYLNRIGAIMFTKYTKNIQKIIATSAYKYPINSMAVLLGQEFLLDVETIQDQSFMTRSWYNFGYGPGDVLPFHSPLDQIMSLMTPALLKPETFKFIP